jgi:hypothetical protein
VPEGKRLSTRSRQTQRTLEAYLASGAPPRWMERLMTVENGIRREKRRLAKAYEEMRGDPERWREYAHRQRFDDLNALIGQPRGLRPLSSAQGASYPPARPVD